MSTSEIISLIALLLAIAGVFIKSRADKIKLDVKLAEIAKDVIATRTETDLKILALTEKINAEFIHRAEVSESNKAYNIKLICDLNNQIVRNAEINREDHSALFNKIDEIKTYLIKNK